MKEIQNKTIWMYWHQGFAEAPDLVNHCVASWQKHHADWTIHLLDGGSVIKHMAQLPISDKKFKQLSLAHQSDLIRTQLLIQYGGVWVDPTCYCLVSLNDWLYKVNTTGLFMFNKPGRDRIISNWFIAAYSQNVALKTLLNELCNYWEKNSFINFNKKIIWYEALIKRIYNRYLFTTRCWFTWFTRRILRIFPYMVYHYKFYQLTRKNNLIKDFYKKMPKISSDGPHRLQRLGLLNPLTPQAKELIDKRQHPLYKLTYKKTASWSENSILAYLFNQ